MAIKKIFEVAMILSANDKASRVIAESVGRQKKSIDSLNNAGDNLFAAGRGAGAVGLGLTAILAGPLKAAADMESMNVSLRTSFQGNEAAAKDAFDKINRFAAATPYGLEEVMTGFIKLKNMGLDPSEEALQAYGNTASAMGKSLNDMVEAVADAATGEFERLKEFGIKAKSEGDKVTFTFQGVKTTVGKNSKEIEQYLKYVGNVKFAGGIEAQSKTAKGMLSTLTDGVVMSAAKIGTAFLPQVKQMITQVSAVVDRISNWVTRNPELTGTIMKVVAGAAALSFAISGTAFVFGGLFKAIAAVRTLMAAYTTAQIAFTAAQAAGTGITGGMTAAMTALNLAFLLSPITWIILGIVALVAAGVWMVKNWDKVSAFFKMLWNNIKNMFSAAWAFIKNLFLNYTPHGLIIKHWDKIVGFFSGLWDRVKNIFWGFVEWWKSLNERFYQYGAEIIMGVWNGIKSKASALFDYVKEVGSKIKNAFKSVLGINSPSKVFAEYGVNITDGAKQGIQKGAPSAVAASTSMGKSMKPNYTPGGGSGGSFSGGGITVNFAPVISGGSASDIMTELRKVMPQLIREIESAIDRKKRLAY